MSVEIREIPQRELRNNVSQILQDVQNGSELRITVRGKAVADLVPVRDAIEATPKHKLIELLKANRPDPDFLKEVDESADNDDLDVWKRHS